LKKIEDNLKLSPKPQPDFANIFGDEDNKFLNRIENEES
jgi:hypothetical protein